MGSGRFAGAFGLALAALPLWGCSLTGGPVVERGLINSPTWAAGVRVDALGHLPVRAANGLAFGVRLDHLAQAAPGATYDRSRYEALVGYSYVPRGFRRTFGFDALARVGFARGAMGGLASTPAAFSAGASFALPIRLSPSRFGADEIIRYTFMLVPQFDVGFACPIEGTQQLQLSLGLGLRVHLDSALLP